MRRIADLDELKKLAAAATRGGDGDGLDVFIALAGGMGRSSKTIRYYPPSDPKTCPACVASRNKRCYECSRPWLVWNDIDDSRQQLSDRGLWTSNHIGEALDKGALFLA